MATADNLSTVEIDTNIFCKQQTLILPTSHLHLRIDVLVQL
jgi:hypothetical protein